MKQFRVRSRFIRLFFAAAALNLLAFTAVHAKTITLVAGGDVNWCRITNQPDVYFDNPKPGKGEWMRVPFLDNPHNRAYLRKTYTRVLPVPSSHYLIAIHYGLHFHSDRAMARYPFRKIAPTLRHADIAFVDLETPLSDTARWQGAFRTPTAFAKGLKWAGIDVATMANNHALDAGDQGIMDTMAALKKAGIGKIGTGVDLEDATKPFIIEKKGIKVAFLGYTQINNIGPSGFALPKKPASLKPPRSYYVKPARSGTAPMDPFLIKKDIKAVRDKADYVVLSLHGGIENSQKTHPAERKFSKMLIDAGADMIIWTHPHVPRGVEVYKGKLIVYDPGNFIFGHSHTYWMDNYLVRITLTENRIKKAEILPVAGRGKDLAQPYLLQGQRAKKLLKDIQTRTQALDTGLRIEGNEGLINLGDYHG
jgi:poly-gamma-glutamate synthesis protein (capsule biosynthesis protein)